MENHKMKVRTENQAIELVFTTWLWHFQNNTDQLNTLVLGFRKRENKCKVYKKLESAMFKV